MSIELESATLAGIAAFRATVEQGNFTRAARVLRVAPQSVSRAVAGLEARLGVTLFRRTTRAVVPTPGAHAYYASCKAAVAQLQASATELRGGTAAQREVLRVSVGTPFAHHLLIPLLPGFVAQHPHARFELHVSNRNVDFVTEEFDLALRLGAARPPNYIVRTLGEFALGVYASPAYLRRAGSVQTPAALAQHQCIGFALPRTGKVMPWTFAAPYGEVAITPHALVGDDVLATLALARAGLGLVQTYAFVAAAEVQRGALVEVLATWRGKGRVFQALYPAGAKPHATARALVAYLQAHAHGEGLRT